jgi:hypothetical protein
MYLAWAGTNKNWVAFLYTYLTLYNFLTVKTEKKGLVLGGALGVFRPSED